MRDKDFKAILDSISCCYREDESLVVKKCISAINDHQDSRKSIQSEALKLISSIRNHYQPDPLDHLMSQYNLSSDEGIALMCLAEALIRIPDKDKSNQLIRDRLTQPEWVQESSKGSVGALISFGLSFTGSLLDVENSNRVMKTLKKVVTKIGQPAIRQVVTQAVKLLGNKFVLGENIDEALKYSKKLHKKGYCFSYDMLGESAVTREDAEFYFNQYMEAIVALGYIKTPKDLYARPGISIKLSALYPRYEMGQSKEAVRELSTRLIMLVSAARQSNISITVDAEESERLEMSLCIVKEVLSDKVTEGWGGFGLAVQAYQKRSLQVVDALVKMARSYHRSITVRLVKGAYWDSEIKEAQLKGLSHYPVFTRKEHTDIAFIACAKKLIEAKGVIYPQFATHNAYTIAHLQHALEEGHPHEFQCLHGMGESLYDYFLTLGLKVNVRMYAPVGAHKELLPYLVRRLLENGANTSFINKLTDSDHSVEKLVVDPIELAQSRNFEPHPCIPLPRHLFSERLNSKGYDLNDPMDIDRVRRAVDQCVEDKEGKGRQDSGEVVINPANLKVIGNIQLATEGRIESAVEKALLAQKFWQVITLEKRAELLFNIADQLEASMDEMIALAVLEAGKTWQDAIDEVREAIDFLRYYADRAKTTLVDQELKGPTGEYNVLSYRPYGVVLCISPWNFPLAIFLGQVAAALVTGNAVIAKPALQTPLIAKRMVDIMVKEGLDPDLLQLLPGDIAIGKALVNHPKVDVVMLTGSTQTAKQISLDLAMKPGAITPLIAETGGQNVMIVDSSALAEQVVGDVIQSAFQSAGQRCSALRVLYLQEEIADKVIHMLKGAMQELKVGNPRHYHTDIGPIIDKVSLERLEEHQAYLDGIGTLIYQVELTKEANLGTFFAPCAYEIDSIKRLDKEVFGPLLHVIRYASKDIDTVLSQINGTGYGLTFGVHSRVPTFVRYVSERIDAGNHYINRNTIGAVVGVQPFGGHGLSGTGPKAGGPNYLRRLCREVTLSNNITAVGGNTTLVTLEDD
ncbi:MAG TPA: bifunctional proline dehydrogenase/L-glutamate gamma-semialdehyde dehydrogenase PutA [Gammaproteobacteria bacterium]|nr:bifunctional proline dehydrogenase/L-glutamate gamma-semialdehyde dehydrogenase PutA [Gammaproteobacteria bacterium]